MNGVEESTHAEAVLVPRGNVGHDVCVPLLLYSYGPALVCCASTISGVFTIYFTILPGCQFLDLHIL